MGRRLSSDVLESPTEKYDVRITGLSSLLMSKMCDGEVGAEISFLPVSQLL